MPQICCVRWTMRFIAKLFTIFTITHHYTHGSTHSLATAHVQRLLDLPVEIIQEALLYLRNVHVLPFALASHQCYDIAEPALNWTIVLPYTRNPSSHYASDRFVNNDKRNVFARSVKMWYIRLVDYSKWYFLNTVGRDLAPLLALPDLQEILCYAPVKGWDGYRQIMDTFSDRLRVLCLEIPGLPIATPVRVSSRVAPHSCVISVSLY